MIALAVLLWLANLVSLSWLIAEMVRMTKTMPKTITETTERGFVLIDYQFSRPESKPRQPLMLPDYTHMYFAMKDQFGLCKDPVRTNSVARVKGVCSRCHDKRAKEAYRTSSYGNRRFTDDDRPVYDVETDVDRFHSSFKAVCADCLPKAVKELEDAYNKPRLPMSTAKGPLLFWPECPPDQRERAMAPVCGWEWYDAHKNDEHSQEQFREQKFELIIDGQIVGNMELLDAKGAIREAMGKPIRKRGRKLQLESTPA